ncbi:MAG: redox-regulated ATPase YchF [Alphaproteobacteria bacterium]|nr:redox-regulated ATPase YchF [Alphaproteobacteria bacterium]
MGFNCGIVGLPNVGKSTLFNALTQTQAAESANYPFCTIEPNTGRVAVPDARLSKLAELAGSQKVIPTQLEFVDIAGLVKGASKGEGLGNQFLGNIREVDAICHVLRCFEDGDITHVDGSIDPIRDADVVETELMLSDMESLEKRVVNLTKKLRGGDKEAKADIDLMERCLEVLREGKPVRAMEIDEDEKPRLKRMQLITSKPVLYVCNVEEESASEGNELSAKVAAWAAEQGSGAVVISAAIEAEIAQMESDEEKQEFLADLGLEETGLARVIRAGYQLLEQITFFTVGPKEARAWTVRNGATAPNAAGVIHTDFERGFICAETTAYDDYVAAGSEAAVKEAGKMRLEGKEYLAKDGDIFNFRFNV